MIRVSDVDKRAESINKASQTVLDDFNVHTTVSLAGRPYYVSLSSDSTTVSVCFKDQQTNVVHLYDVQSFKAPVMYRFRAIFLALCFATISLGVVALVVWHQACDSQVVGSSLGIISIT